MERIIVEPQRHIEPNEGRHPIELSTEPRGGTAVYSCKTHTLLTSIGDCGMGCCDDYFCPDCKDAFRVEWPD